MNDFNWWQNTIIVVLILLIIESWFGFLERPLNKLFEGFKLRPYEQKVFDAWRGALTPAEALLLDTQLAQLSFFQRGGGSAKINFFYQKPESLKLFNHQNAYIPVAKVSLQGKNPSKYGPLHVKIFIQDGRFFSIEFPKRPKRMAEQRGWTLKELEVTDVSILKEISAPLKTQ